MAAATAATALIEAVDTAARGGTAAAMCTVVLTLRPGHPWPVLLAANRDERLDRPWDLPGAHWPDRRGVVAGQDRLGGGTWMAVGPSVVAAVLNRPGSLGPAPGKLSRGDLPLLAAGCTTAAEAVNLLCALDAGAYRTFNLVVADRAGAWFVRGLGSGQPEGLALAPGTHIVTAYDPGDPASPRGIRHLPLFQAASVPDPGRGDWSAWINLLGDSSGGTAALNVAASGGFGTVCSSLVGFPASGLPVWLFAAGPPDQAPFRPVPISAAQAMSGIAATSVPPPAASRLRL